MQILRILQPLWQPFGVDLFCFGKKFLVSNLVSRNLKTKYRRSLLGLLWTLLVPMAMAVIYYVVFNVFLKVKVPHYLAFIMSGVIPYNFFSQSILEGMESIVGNGGLASKIPMPLQVFPFVGTVTNLVTLFISMPIVLGACWVSHVSLGPSLALLPLYLILLFMITYGLSFLLSVMFVFFRDLRHIMGIGMQLLFYLTPVLYSDSMVPEQFRWILLVNPVGGVVMGFHSILAEGAWPLRVYMISSISWALVMIIVAAVIHKTLISKVVEQI